MSKNWGGLDILTNKGLKSGLSANNAYNLAESLSNSNFENAIRDDKLFQKILERKASQNVNKVNKNNAVNIANNIVSSALQEYLDIESKFINIFQKTCNQRSEEHILAKNAKKQSKELSKFMENNVAENINKFKRKEK